MNLDNVWVIHESDGFNLSVYPTRDAAIQSIRKTFAEYVCTLAFHGSKCTVLSNGRPLAVFVIRNHPIMDGTNVLI
jgi:hypothetical protein